MHPEAVARHPELLLVDLRPAAERRSELGFVPVSLGLPLAGTEEELRALLARERVAEGVVLCCTSGRRSGRLREALAQRFSAPLFSLEGGVFGWEAAGLPLCRVQPASPEGIVDGPGFRDYLVSCFVAESAEVALDHGVQRPDPLGSLEACFADAGVSWERPTLEGLFRVIDRAALAMWRAGGSLAHIATNVSEMYSLLEAVEKQPRG